MIVTETMLGNVQSSSGANSTEQNAAASEETGSADFQTFLTLLTTQLRNQDPLQPIDSTQFVSQLASFSAVEQQVRTNEKLAEIVALLSDQAGTSAIASGRAGAADTAGAAVTEQPFQVYWTSRPDADLVRIDAFDASDVLLTSQIEDSASGVAFWDGVEDNNTVAARFVVTSFRQGEIIDIQVGAASAALPAETTNETARNYLY